MLIGNLTRDPELKYTPQGTAVCTFGVATNRSWTTTTGELREEAQFHRIVAWQKLAELCGKLLTKGKKVYLEGRLTYRTFTGRDGVQRTVAEIVLDDFVIFDSARKAEVAVEEKAAPVEEVPPSGLEEEKMEVKEAAEEKESTDKDKDVAEEEKVEPEDIPF
jgi:single-strand DNA-binding protein